MDTLTDLHRFDDQIAEIERVLRSQPPQPGGILLYGSSTMANWRANDWCYRQLAPLPISNTGFGGATSEELLYFYHRLLLPAKPSIMVYYGGANDLINGYIPEDIVETSHRLFEWCRQDLPGIRIIILPVKLSPGLPIDMAEGKRCNRMFAEYAEAHADTSIVDVDSLLYDARGEWRRDIYVEDMLHHNEQGYVELAVRVKAAIEKVWSK